VIEQPTDSHSYFQSPTKLFDAVAEPLELLEKKYKTLCYYYKFRYSGMNRKAAAKAAIEKTGIIADHKSVLNWKKAMKEKDTLRHQPGAGYVLIDCGSYSTR